MSAYLLVKVIHIISSTVLFGTGLGIAWFMWRAHRAGDVHHIAKTTREVVIADMVFTAPAVMVQPATGLFMVYAAGWDLTQTWLAWSLALYLLAGACWLPVVWLQWRMRDLAAEAVREKTDLPARHQRYFRLWFALGWPAFLGLIAVFYLMVAKPI